MRSHINDLQAKLQSLKAWEYTNPVRSADMSGKPVCIADFEEYAKNFLPKYVYDYYRSGADDQETLADNVAAFSR